MSLNASQLDANGVPVLVPGERLFSQTRGVKMDYESGSGYPGEGHCYYANSGVLFLTSVRVVYVPVPPTPFLQNLTVPLELLSNGTLVQPWFDANRYEANVTPVPNGGLAIPGTVKWGFKEGGGFEFASVFLQLRGRIATGAAGPNSVRCQEEEALPLYTPEAPSPTGTTAQPTQQRSGTGPVRMHVVPIPIPTEAPPEYSQPSEGAHPSV